MDQVKVLHKIVSSNISVPQDDFFDTLVKKIDDHYDTLSFNTFNTLKKSNKSLEKGILFEIICYKLLEKNAFNNINIQSVWFTSNIQGSNHPYNILSEENRLAFSLGKKDMGIDLVVLTTDNNWLAIQCKYRKKPRRSTAPNGKRIYWSVKWSELSTFYSLCQRTGPYNNSSNNSTWEKHVVMTNAPSTNRQGRKNDKDLSICLGSFRSIPKSVWLNIIGYTGYTLNQPINNINLSNLSDINNIVIQINKDKNKDKKGFLREKRSKFLDQLEKPNNEEIKE